MKGEGAFLTGVSPRIRPVLPKPSQYHDGVIIVSRRGISYFVLEITSISISSSKKYSVVFYIDVDILLIIEFEYKLSLSIDHLKDILPPFRIVSLAYHYISWIHMTHIHTKIAMHTAHITVS